MNANLWTVREVTPQTHVVDFPVRKSGDIFYALVMSDEHWDNVLCDRKLITSHHIQAVERGAPVFKFGDTFCAMQGRWDKRADQDQLREEHRGNDYLDKLVDTATDFYKPFAKNIALICPGNHEDSIYGKHQTNLTKRLATGLGCLYGDYWGYVSLVFRYKTHIQTIQLCYHHGYGGGGEVTRGMIDNSRTRGQYNADIYYSGHIHRRNMDENIITELNSTHHITRRRQLFLRGSTYKHEVGGWHSRQGRASRPLGGWWLKFTCVKTKAGLVVITEPEMAN